MANGLYKTKQKFIKLAKKLYNMRSKWLISYTIRPPFIKITKYSAKSGIARGKTEVILVDLSALKFKRGPVLLDLVKPDPKLDILEYKVYMYYGIKIQEPTDPVSIIKLTNFQ